VLQSDSLVTEGPGRVFTIPLMIQRTLTSQGDCSISGAAALQTPRGFNAPPTAPLALVQPQRSSLDMNVYACFVRSVDD
jgi:hypothetical protein